MLTLGTLGQTVNLFSGEFNSHWPPHFTLQININMKIFEVLGYIDTTAIEKALNSCKRKVLNKGKSSEAIEAIFNNALSKFNIIFDVSGRNKDEDDDDESGLAGGGYYHSGIIAVKHIDYWDDLFDEAEDDFWPLFMSKAMTIIKHELVHRQQAQRIRNKFSDPKAPTSNYMGPNANNASSYAKYLSNPHEIGAFSTDAVHELLNNRFTLDEILERIRTEQGVFELAVYGKSIEYYINEFDFQGPIFKRFLAAIVKAVNVERAKEK